MPSYYVNKDTNEQGSHDVHTSNCPYLPYEANRIALGFHFNSKEAIKQAKEHYSKVKKHSFCLKD